MSTRFAAMGIAALFILTGGCGKNRQARSSNKPAPVVATAPTVSDSAPPAPPASATPVSSADAAAIRTAIEDHLRGNRGIKMDAMNMSVDSISLTGDQAQAHTSFRIKNGGVGMSMVYYLQRKGDGWVVTKSQTADPEMSQPPSDAAPTGMDMSQATPDMPDVNAFFKQHPAPKSN